jgi:hypothetical protein
LRFNIKVWKKHLRKLKKLPGMKADKTALKNRISTAEHILFTIEFDTIK